MLALVDAEPSEKDPSSCKTSNNNAVPRMRGVCMRSYRRGGRPMYQADISPMRGFRVRSALQESLESAIECHIILTSAKRLAQHGEGRLEDRVKCAFKPLADTRYCTQVHAHKFIGRKLYSPETLDVEEALSTWRKLWAALHEGWPLLRETWISVQSESCSKRGSDLPGKRWGRNRGTCTRTREQLEAIVASWEMDDIDRRRRALAREQRRAERILIVQQEELRRAHRMQERRARLVVSLGNQYEACCQSEEREDMKRKKEILRARWQWHKQKDLTMDQILQGPPI